MISLVVVALAASIAVLSMVAFGILGMRRDVDADRRGSQFAGGLGNFLVHWIMWVLGPIERLSLRLGASPTFFNGIGLVCGILSGILIAGGHVHAGGWAIAAGGLADILDGRIARRRDMSSDYGKFIDSTLDRFVEVFTFLGITIYLRATPWGSIYASAAIAGSLLVSYARARGESVGEAGPKGFMQRAERLVLTCLACLFDPPLSPFLGLVPGAIVSGTMAVIAVCSFVTAIHRAVAIAKALYRRQPVRVSD